MQVICNNTHILLDIDIAHPTSISDYLVFGISLISELFDTYLSLAEGLTI